MIFIQDFLLIIIEVTISPSLAQLVQAGKGVEIVEIIKVGMEVIVERIIVVNLNLNPMKIY